MVFGADGQIDGWTDGRMDRWTHVWKFTLVAYRTSALAAQKGKTSKCNSYAVEPCSNRTTTYGIPHIMDVN